jgi:hypothetical protein
MRIEVYIVPIFIVITVIVLGIMIYIDERKDAKRQLKDKESNNV